MDQLIEDSLLLKEKYEEYKNEKLTIDYDDFISTFDDDNLNKYINLKSI